MRFIESGGYIYIYRLTIWWTHALARKDKKQTGFQYLFVITYEIRIMVDAGKNHRKGQGESRLCTKSGWRLEQVLLMRQANPRLPRGC
jgi:hypothetical protein